MAREPEAFFRAVTELVFLRDAPQPSDVLFIPGSSREGPVRLAAQLFREGFAPRVLPSGRYGIGEQGFRIPGYATEADWMRSLLLAEGVPDGAILPEREATYTWENAQFSRRLCDAAGIRVRRGLLCCRPFHARRALMYYQTVFPETDWTVCPCREEGLNAEDWTLTPEGRARVLGEVRRLGDQIKEQLEELIAHG